ncbi:polymer-forming cytoskeletal protein [Patescibacteria group bacterium]|nr:polymer-forming cytoskeletal protein [Patescibacteria group bacterium]MBU0963830.1 polymer-forming cytoskeletal protein [Patescibacteria group bacterium]
MALFSNEEQDNREVETIIGPSVKVEGNFSSEGNITVEGVVHGTLKTKHNLKIGSKAKVKAEVEANDLFLSGEIRGNVKVLGKAKLTQSAKIFGNLDTKILTIEEGAIMNGKCTMVAETEALIKEIKKNSKE